MASKNDNNTSRTLQHWHNFRLKLLVEGMLIGVVVGLIIVLYRMMLDKGEAIHNSIYVIIENSGWWAAAIWFLALVLIGYMKLFPEEIHAYFPETT